MEHGDEEMEEEEEVDHQVMMMAGYDYYTRFPDS